MSPVDPSADFMADRLCQDTVIRFCGHFDADEAEAAARLFAPTGVWHRSDGDLHGPEALKALMARRAGRVLARHLLANLRTTLHDAGHATVDSYVIAWKGDPPPPGTAPAPVTGTQPYLMGRYRDDLVLHQGLWKIARRQLFVDFVSGA